MPRAYQPPRRIHLMSSASTSSVSHRQHPSRGFTLLEVMVAMVIAGVLLGLAGPPFKDFVIRQGMRNASFELMSDLAYARSEAVKRNVSVTISEAGTWSKGWTIAAGESILRQHPALPDNVSVTMAYPSIAFLLNGRASGPAKFTIDDAGGKAGIPARCVSVDPSGRPQSTEGSCS
jgi:type IV fimbrial biogenesis protein FimT